MLFCKPLVTFRGIQLTPMTCAPSAANCSSAAENVGLPQELHPDVLSFFIHPPGHVLTGLLLFRSGIPDGRLPGLLPEKINPCLPRLFLEYVGLEVHVEGIYDKEVRKSPYDN